MNSQEISTGIMKNKETGDSIWFTLACDCMSSECNTIIEMEIDKKDKTGMVLIFYKEFYFQYNNPFSGEILESIKYLWKGIWWRIKSSLRILFIGHIKISSDICLVNEEHINCLIKALEEGKKYCYEKSQKR
jgi:hypothetical protein